MNREKEYSGNIVNVIKNYLEKDEWKFSFDKEKGVFEFSLGLGGKMKRISYLIAVEQDGFEVYALSPLGVDVMNKTMVDEMAKYVCFVNDKMRNGNFEFNIKTGELRYKIYVDCQGITPTEEMLKTSIGIPCGAFEHFGSNFMRIIFNNAIVEEVIGDHLKGMVEQLLEQANSKTDRKDGGEITEEKPTTQSKSGRAFLKEGGNK